MSSLTTCSGQGVVVQGKRVCIRGYQEINPHNNLLSCLWVDHPHPDDSPQELLVRIGWLLSPEPLEFFMAEKGLNPEIVVHSKSLELLGQGKVGEDHVMDLGQNKSVFIERRPNLFRHTCCPDR